MRPWRRELVRYLRRPVRRRRAAWTGSGPERRIPPAFLTLGVALVVAASVIALLENKLRPVVVEIAAAQAQNTMTAVVENAVTADLAARQVSYADFVTIQRDEGGAITALTTDMARMNLLRSELTAAVLEALEGVDVSDVQVPLGSLFDLEPLWAKGPALKAKAMTVGTVRAEFDSQFTSAGVEGLTMYDIQPVARDITARTGIKFTFAHENGVTVIRAKGEASHAAYPEGGNNAITGLISLLCALPLADGGCKDALHDLNALIPHGDCKGRALGIAQQEPIAGPLTVAFSLLEVTETGLEGFFDSRVPLCATEENCLNVAKAAFEGKGFTFEAVQGAPHHVPASSPFIKTLLTRYEEYTGLKGECLSTGGGTYVHDIPGGVAFGCTLPGFDTHLHGADERVRVSDLMLSAKLFAHVILDLCG